VSVTLSASAVSHAQAPANPITPLAGFRYVRIQAPQYPDGNIDPWRLAPYLEKLLAKQGWSVLRGSEELFRPEARQMASETIQCSIGIDYAGFGTTAYLRCADVIGREFFTISGKGVAISEGGELKAALRDVAKRLQTTRPQFDASQTVDILSRLPFVETYPVTEAAIDEMAQAGKLRAAVEGLWAITDEGAYRLGIISVDSGREFVVVTLESPRTYLWQPGMVKAHLTATADGRTFAATWRMGDRREASGMASLKGGSLTLSLKRDGKEETLTLLKLRPTVTAFSAGTLNSEPVVSGTGTAFVCAAGIVATNHHVIDEAKTVELYLPLQKRSVKLQLLVSDATNDVALLRVVDGSQDELPPGHKVTSGLVSALDGINGDPRMLQLTAPIQPGSSGSPVFDSRGHVIGVVTSSLDTFAAVRAVG
jgi:hypothetical protein